MSLRGCRAKKTTGKVYEWTSEGGVRYQYVIPRKYDAKVGAAMTVILHGSNLDRRWGFANHEAVEFRPQDIVISPDGTTPNGKGGFNFMGRGEDASKLTGLLDELRATLNVTAVYLYGHSQGSFFALDYAGEEPEAIAGVVAHASGVWTLTNISDKGHGQAIVLMHGTADPVMPYSQSVGGYAVYRDKEYPMIRMRSLEGWNHWPAEKGSIPHVSQQLAWIEGMTASETSRLGAAYGILSKPKVKTQHDFGALYQVSVRLSNLSSPPARARGAAGKTAKKVEALAKGHIAAMKLEEPDEGAVLDGAPWVGSLPMFLRAYAGVPAADELAEKWESMLKVHEEAALKHFRKYWVGVNGGDSKSAFEAGLGAMSEAFLSVRTSDPTFLKKMETWSDDLGLGISRDDLRAYKKLESNLEKSLKKGRAAFESTNKRGSI